MTTTSTDSVFDFKDEIEMVEPPREKLKSVIDSSKSKSPKIKMLEPSVPTVSAIIESPGAELHKLPRLDYARSAALTGIEAMRPLALL